MSDLVAVDLGDWLAGMPMAGLEHSLVDQAGNHLLDTLGAMVAGQGERVAAVARAVHSAPGPVPLPGTDETREARDAAFANAVAAHSLEIDDTEGCDHSGAVVVPVLWSLNHGPDRQRLSRLLPALVAGYEVGRRVQLALGGYDEVNGRGWHSTATCGVFAAAAASAVMLALEAEQAAAALGIAASAAAGTWAFAADGAMTKQLHAGNAARAGLEAALLAAGGATGPLHVFEDVWGGFLRAYGGDPRAVGRLTAELGSTWHFRHSAIKPYAVCRSAHSAIDALTGILRDADVDASEVAEVRLHVSDFLRPMICPARPRDAAQARMSLPIAAALVLDGSGLMPHDFDAFDSKRVQDRLDQIVVVRDPAADAEPLVEVRARGRLHRRRGTRVRGGQEDPLTALEVRRKFARLAVPVIGADGAATLQRWVDSAVLACPRAASVSPRSTRSPS